MDAQILTKEGVTKERLARYPLFDVQFLDWLYAQFPAERLPIYLAHFRFIKRDHSGGRDTSQKDYWEQVYTNNAMDRVGWYEPHLQTSLTWIKELGLTQDAPIIDVGGGACTLVDDLLDAGYRSITVLDISKQALSLAQGRLGSQAQRVTWLAGDITSVTLPAQYYDLWHDRAVLHFLTAREQQQRYRDNLLKALKPGGHLVIGIFAPEGPDRCSGLTVQRYSPEQLESALGEEFELKRHRKELHITPDGTQQMYLYCHFRRTA